MPGFTRYRLIFCLELFVELPAVEVSLKLSDVPLLAVETAHLIEYFDKYSKQRVQLGFADDIGLLVDVKQDAF